MKKQDLPLLGSTYVPYRDFHSTEWTRTVTKLKDLSPSDKLVLSNLAGRAGLDGVCHPSVSTVAKDTGLDPRTVRRSINKMRDNGFISWIPGDVRKNQANEYSFHWNQPLDLQVRKDWNDVEADSSGGKDPRGQNAPRGENALPKEKKDLKTNQDKKEDTMSNDKNKSRVYLEGHSDSGLSEEFCNIAEEMSIPSSSWRDAYSFTVDCWGEDPNSVEMLDALTIWKQSGTESRDSQLVGSGGYSADTRAFLGEDLMEDLEQAEEEIAPPVFLPSVGMEGKSERKSALLERFSHKITTPSAKKREEVSWR